MSNEDTKTAQRIIDVRDIVKNYKQGKLEVKALRGLSLGVEPGEFTVLAGSSGSGKTTLLNIIGGLDAATKGEVLIEGRSLSDMKRRARADLRLQRIGFVFQAYNLIPVLTAYENAEYVMLLQGVATDERRRRVDEVLGAVGLAGLGNRRPAELSGGQQQRVAVARAIAAQPALVLADEPTANLDSKTGTDLIDTMLELNQQRGITFVISSHDPKVIERARRVVRLEDGRIVADDLQPMAA